jgi:hypothetical protein
MCLQCLELSFEWIGGDEPPLEKRRRERGERRLAELHFKWFNAVAAGDMIAALTAALDWDEVAAEVYGRGYGWRTGEASLPANWRTMISAAPRRQTA